MLVAYAPGGGAVPCWGNLESAWRKPAAPLDMGEKDVPDRNGHPFGRG